MQLKVEQSPNIDDISVLIQYAERSHMLARLVATVQGFGEKVEARDGDKTIMLAIADIYYFESVDKKTFAYCRHEVYQVSDRLYEIEDKLSRFGFTRINKASLLNINTLESIRNIGNSKMEATLSNGEKINVSRKYINEIKAAIKR